MVAKEGITAALISMTVRVVQAIEKRNPRSGPGRPPEIPDWFLAAMIVVAIARHKKSKAAQFRFWLANRDLLADYQGEWRFPSKSTFYERYRRIDKIFRQAIDVNSQRAIRYGWADPKVVSVDKSVIPARGRKPKRHKHKRSQRRVDSDASWTVDSYHGWTYGYSYEVVVSSTDSTITWPLMASVDTGSRSEAKTLAEKIPKLPAGVRYVLADRGYDADDHCEALEWQGNRRTKRRFVCPTRKSSRGPAQKEHKRSRNRKRRQAHRKLRTEFVKSPQGRKLYALRSKTIEPFNSWLKCLFDFHDRVWHRGIENNRTQILAAVFIYQLLLMINRQNQQRDGRIKHLLDQL